MDINVKMIDNKKVVFSSKGIEGLKELDGMLK